MEQLNGLATPLSTSPVGPPKQPTSHKQDKKVVAMEPGSFEPALHFYPRVLNAQIHPLVRTFLSLGNDRVTKRYCHLHPEAKPEAVKAVLAQAMHYFQWGGADLFSTTNEHGHRRFVVVETNSCPSGQKSMPLVNEDMEQAGYRTLLEKAFIPTLLSRTDLPQGHLAVLYDKNKMEAGGYAAVLADLTGETVYLTPCYADDPKPKSRFTDDGVLEVRVDGACVVTPDVSDTASIASSVSSESDNDDNEVWIPMRAAIRYVTQRPWTRIPPLAKTYVFNPVLACLAGGRNKMLAAKGYDLYNASIKPTGLTIYTPETIWDVARPEVPLWVARMGGLAVVKVPYANAGQGVWTITSEEELREFMGIKHRYERFIVQALIGNHGWSSNSATGKLYHVGTIPNSKSNIYAADLRLMVGSSPEGFFPVAIYARRARLPLTETLTAGHASWDMLGTNLSYKKEDGSWGTETERLLLMDSRDFNRVGIGLDDLIEAYMQTVLAVSAIDMLATKLVSRHGTFCNKLFQSMNPDPRLLEEIYLLKAKPSPQAVVPETAVANVVKSMTDPNTRKRIQAEEEAILNGKKLKAVSDE